VRATGKPEPLIQAPFDVTWGQVSPNGRWLLYVSNESGREETYVRPYVRSGARTQVSTNGSFGMWWHDGREILMLAGDNRLTATATDRGNQLDIG